MSNFSQRVEIISGKLTKLKKEMDQLKKDNQSLKLRTNHLEDRLGEELQKYKNLEEEYKRIKLAKTLVSTGGDKAEMKYRVNEMVREIDKCIALLNR